MNFLWGIDLGGTKIEGVVLPGSDEPEPVVRIRHETQADQGYGHVLERIALLVERMSEESGRRPARLGMGTPGSQNRATGRMRNCNTTCLNGMPLHADLESRLGIPVAMANDANCFSLAEAKWGAGIGYETVFGVILGTGVGGGLVVHGRALEGANGIAGEWGHNVFDPGGPNCYCGKKGCVETFLSGPANEREFYNRTGLPWPLPKIVEQARTETGVDAQDQIDLLCRRFGRALAAVINIFDPDAVVLGGGVGQIDELYTAGRHACEYEVFSDRFDTPFLRPKLGDSAGVFGAALLNLY